MCKVHIILVLNINYTFIMFNNLLKLMSIECYEKINNVFQGNMLGT